MRILIADDEAINRLLLQHMLEDEGYTDIYEAENGLEAIRIAEETPPDLVLLDVLMPEMDGFTAAPILKEKADDIYLPIIFITALEDQDSLVRCLQVGGDDFASKPFDKLILSAKIKAHARIRELSKKTHQQNQQLTFYRNAVEREHNIIEHIFSNALVIKPIVKEYIDYRLAPATNFNGDLFLAEPSPSGGLYILLGDFTGHGLASAIGALPVSKSFQAMALKGLSVAEMAQTINSTLMSLLPGDMFFAAAIIEISTGGNQITVWNGGMPHMILLSKNGEIRRRIDSMHMALGILDDYEFEDEIEFFEARPGDRLIGYSDGVIELIDENDNMLRAEGLEAWLTTQPDISIGELLDKVAAYKGKAEQLDDFTLISYTAQPLDNIAALNQLPTVPFYLEIHLHGEQLREADPVQEMIHMLGSQQGLQGLRSDLFTVMTELYNNALDHGILQLDSKLKQSEDGFFAYFDKRESLLSELSTGSIQLKAAYEPIQKMLSISIQDSGQGFDYHKVPSASEQDPFGRGLALIRDLCDDVAYSDGGRCATVMFHFGN